MGTRVSLLLLTLSVSLAGGTSRALAPTRAPVTPRSAAAESQFADRHGFSTPDLIRLRAKAWTQMNRPSASRPSSRGSK